MDHMLEKVEKASQVLNEAEKMNLDLSSAKTEQKKRRSSTDSVSIQISNQSELVEEIVDLFKAPAATTSSEVVGKEKKTEPIRMFENSRQIKARGSLSGGDQQNEKHLPQSEQNEDSDLEKKRRSSFAASFYSSPNALRPKSERSLRRSSNSRSVNYDEEQEQVKNVGKEDRTEVHEARPEIQEARPEVHEAIPEVKETNSKSPIRRKKHYLNEQNNLINISEEGNQNPMHIGNSKPKERRVRKPAENSNVEAKKPVKKRRVTIAGS